MPLSDAKKKADAKYRKKSYDEMKLKVLRGEKDQLKEYSNFIGETLNAFVTRAIRETIERDKESLKE